MNREEKSYYEIMVKRMDTDTYPRNEKSTDLEGLIQGQLLDDAAMKELISNYWATGSDGIEIAIEDNGPCGDGIWLTIYPATQLANFQKGECIIAVRLTAKQAAILGKTISLVADLHEVTK